jgi:glycosyltransferase involved in cell wall biosynthesis
MEFSIVVPMYNVSTFVKRCIDSIVNQTFRDFELIIVNDGSTDGSLKIAKDALSGTEIENRLKIINQKNNGVGFSRNVGLKYAQGKYVFFIDSDDFLSVDALRKLHDIIHGNDYDIVFFNAFSVLPNGIKLRKKNLCGEFLREVIVNNESLRKLIILPTLCWNKVYKKSFLENGEIKFPEKIVYEDVVFAPLAVLKAKKIFFLEDAIYNYVQRENSITKRSLDDKQIEDILDANRLLISDFKKLKCFGKFRDEIELIAIKTVLFNVFNSVILNDVKDERLYKLINFIEDFFPYYYNNSYLNKTDLKMINLIKHRRLKLYRILYGGVIKFKLRLKYILSRLVR